MPGQPITKNERCRGKIKEGFCSLEAIKLLEIEEWAKTKISRGQQKLILASIAKLSRAGSDTAGTSTDVTSHGQQAAALPEQLPDQNGDDSSKLTTSDPYFYSRRIIDTINLLKADSHKVKLTGSIRADITWWNTFLATFNGKSMLLDHQPIQSVFTDSCSLAAGGFFDGDWFYLNWALDWPFVSQLHINSKEILAVYLAVCRWSSVWRNKRIYIQSDNVVTVSTISRGTSRNPILMSCLRHLFWLSATFNFHITAHFIRGSKNTLADSISRMHEPLHFMKLQPLLNTSHPCRQLSQCSFSFLFDRFASTKEAGGHARPGSVCPCLNMFAESTRKTYQSQQSLYLQFCKSLCISPVPISLVNLGRYIAFLASRLCYSSIRQYFNIVRLMHLDEGYPSPLSDSWYLSSILKGLRRCKGESIKQKLPITTQILQQILSVLNLSHALT